AAGFRDRAFAARAAEVNPEAVIFSRDAGAEEAVAAGPVPMHRRVLQRRRGGEGIAVVQVLRHADAEAEALVTLCGRPPADDRAHRRRAVGAGALAVFVVEQRDVLALPGRISNELERDGSVVTLELDVVDVEAQVGQRETARVIGAADGRIPEAHLERDVDRRDGAGAPGETGNR